MKILIFSVCDSFDNKGETQGRGSAEREAEVAALLPTSGPRRARRQRALAVQGEVGRRCDGSAPHCRGKTSSRRRHEKRCSYIRVPRDRCLRVKGWLSLELSQLIATAVLGAKMANEATARGFILEGACLAIGAAKLLRDLSSMGRKAAAQQEPKEEMEGQPAEPV